MSKCYCNSCVEWSPRIKRIKKALPEKLWKEFDGFILHSMCQNMDGAIAQAKLDGSWPGWEWLPKMINFQNKKMAGLRNKTLLDPRSND